MKVVVIAGDDHRWEEFLSRGIPDAVEVARIRRLEELVHHASANAFFDLSFVPSLERLRTHRSLFPTPVFVNCVDHTHKELETIAHADPGIPDLANITRINAWPTFLKRNIIEIAETKTSFKDVFEQLGWRYEVVSDIPGLITPRVISMIINEAWFTLEEKVSTKEEIDTAMKLGTNYPYGPFEWGEKIGLKNIYELLTRLAKTNSRYQPCTLLEKQVLNQ
jgi:3-hydroxybutyryl-CoA dehydrogenase